LDFDFFLENIRFRIAMLLIAIGFIFNAAIFSNPPNIGDLAILVSGGFTFVMVTLWLLELRKSKYGKILLIIVWLNSAYPFLMLLHDLFLYSIAYRKIGIVCTLLSVISLLILVTLHEMTREPVK
jgi:hypothetical protein